MSEVNITIKSPDLTFFVNRTLEPVFTHHVVIQPAEYLDEALADVAVRIRQLKPGAMIELVVVAWPR